MIDWNDENVKKLRDLYQSGMTISGIGREFGCGRNAISGKIARLGIADRGATNDDWIRAKKAELMKRPRLEVYADTVKELNERGWSHPKIAEHIGVHKQTIANWCRKLGLKAHFVGCDPYTEEEDRIITDMTRSGCSNKAIAERIGRTEMAVAGRKTNLGLCRKVHLNGVGSDIRKSDIQIEIEPGTYRNERGITLPLISCLAKPALVYAEGM